MTEGLCTSSCLQVVSLGVTEAVIERESGIQVQKWRESRGELTHQPGRRLHGTRPIHELKLRSASSISRKGSFSFLGGGAPSPGPLRASSSLLSLPGFRRSKASFRSHSKTGSFSGSSASEPTPAPVQVSPGSSSPTAPSCKPPLAPDPACKPPQNPDAPPLQSTAATSPNARPEPCPAGKPPSGATPRPASRGKEAGTRRGGEEEGKKQKKSKEDKKREKEEEKLRAREQREREKAEKERQKKERKKEKGGKKGREEDEAEKKGGAKTPRDGSEQAAAQSSSPH